MRDVYLAVAIAELAVVLLLMIRLGRGPTVTDRIVALNTISTQTALALLFFAAWADRTIDLDVAIWLASFSYLGAIVWSRYLEAGAAVITEVAVIALAVVGLAFSLSAAVGILRMPDVYCRIQCASKTVTMGAIPTLVALVVAKGPISSYGGRALLCAALLFVLGPVAGHALARAAYKAGVPMWQGAVRDEPREGAEPGSADG